MSLLQITYISHAVTPFSEEDLGELMRHCRRNNRHLGLSGLLLYQDGRFLQVIEGEPDVLWSLYKTISNDPRHHSVEIVAHREIHAREFARWRMGLGILGDGVPEALTSLDQRVREILRASDPEGDAALEMLHQFRDLDQSHLMALSLHT